ncbi:MAG: ParB/RepB/Spo0J family partition protein [Spirochaetaceae bacterium]|jgi:ParB family chromosome partitioning protein|nr:ParB/RepB/Spo0J family partition protein [Spirochaetaceae bacterium]
MAKLGMLRSAQTKSGTQDSKSINLTIKDIPIGDIQTRENVRKTYSGLDELAESIRQHGLLQPITVYADGDDFVVKTGHRRFKAYQKLHSEEPERFHSIRSIVSGVDNLAVVQLVENVQREELNQIDLYNALCALREQGLANREIATAIGKDESYVRKIFVAVKEMKSDKDLEDAVCYAGVTIEDIVETKGIADKGMRLEILERRGKGEVKRAEMRQKVKEFKAENGPKQEREAAVKTAGVPDSEYQGREGAQSMEGTAGKQGGEGEGEVNIESAITCLRLALKVRDIENSAAISLIKRALKLLGYKKAEGEKNG